MLLHYTIKTIFIDTCVLICSRSTFCQKKMKRGIKTCLNKCSGVLNLQLVAMQNTRLITNVFVSQIWDSNCHRHTLKTQQMIRLMLALRRVILFKEKISCTSSKTHLTADFLNGYKTKRNAAIKQRKNLHVHLMVTSVSIVTNR